MAPLGTEVLAHTKTNQRASWGYHAAQAWYLSHAPNHYRCIKILMKDTGSKRITDTFHFNHHKIPLPTISDANRIIEATKKLTSAIAGRQDAPPNKLEAIQALRSILLGQEPTPSNTVLPALTRRPPTSTPMVVHAEEPPIQMWNPHAQPPPTQQYLSSNTPQN